MSIEQIYLLVGPFVTFFVETLRLSLLIVIVLVIVILPVIPLSLDETMLTPAIFYFLSNE